MRLREVFRYEVAHRLGSPSTWAYAAFLFALGFLIVHVAEGDVVHVDAPEKVAAMAVRFCGVFGMLVTAALFGDAAIRDVAVGMDPLLYTTRLRKSEYLGGRFLAALAVNAIVLLAIPAGLATAARMPYQDAESFGSFRLAAYVQPYLLYLLPNVVLVGAILFAIASLVRQVVPVYLAAIAFFIGYVVASNYWSHLGAPLVALLADALGINAMEELTRYWTPAERNTRLIGFPAVMLANRALWLTVAAAVLVTLHRVFRFEHAAAGGRRRGGARDAVDTPAGRDAPVAVPRVAGTFGARTRMLQVLAVAGRSFAELLASRAFPVTVAGCAGLVLLMGWNVGSTVFDTSTWPVTFLVAEEVVGRRLLPIVWVLIAVYAGELVWKEREVGTAEIGDAVPLPDGVALLGRFVALVVVIGTFLVAFVAGGIVLQALQGHRHFEPGAYASILALHFADFVLLGALAMLVHVLVNQKYLAHIVVLLCFASTKVVPALGIRHHLLLYGTDPGWTYSDMNRLDPFLGPYVAFKLYWAACALVLGVVASLAWVRGREPGLRGRLRQARARLDGPLARVGGVGLALVVLLGGFVYYNTNVRNEFVTPAGRDARQAEYERRYRRFMTAPQPTIVAADLRIEIHPEQPGVDLAGRFRLVNRTATPIDSLHVVLDRRLDVRSLAPDRPARTVLEDRDHGYRVFALARPLAPGDSLALAFDVGFRPRGFTNDEAQTDVTRNTASFNRLWMPFIGYQPLFELSGGGARRRQGLEPRPTPGADDASALGQRYPWRDADDVDVHAIIGTSPDQVAITPGVLRRSWQADGRRWFEYQTRQPTAFGATVYSGRYAVARDHWNGVDLRIFHHPQHAYVLDRMLRSMKASLDYCTAEFGPYPDRELWIVEFPRYGGFGIAHPHTIGFAEDAFLSRVRDGEVDQPFYGTAHEIAHQWWGGQARGADVRGAGFLTESLANYTAMAVTAKAYGPAAARRVRDFQMERYLRGRGTRGREVPVLEVEDQAFIAYRKGALALDLLRERIGEPRVNGALRRYLARFRGAGPPYATARDLYAELRAVTPDSLRPLLHDLFEDVVLWDVATKRAVVAPAGDGTYVVTLDVEAKKLRADSTGAEHEVPFDEDVEVGVFGKGGEDGADEPLYRARHRMHSGTQAIRVTVSRPPARAGVDPPRMLLESDRDDNVVDVEPR